MSSPQTLERPAGSVPARGGRGTGAPRRRRRIRPSAVIATAVLVAGAAGMVVPFVWMAVTSLKTTAHVYDLPPSWFPKELHWKNYHDAFTGSVPLLRNLLNSVVISVASTTGLVITAPMAGYAFARLKFRGSTALLLTLLASLMVPVQVTIIPLWLIMKNLSLLNSPLSLILPSVTGAFGVFLMRQFFLTLPDEIFDAARIDGAGPWNTYRFVALPLVKNGITTMAIIWFVLTWNAFFAPSIFLNSVHTATLPLAMVLLVGPYGTGQVNVLMAATTFAVLPILIAYIAAQRLIIDSFTQSGIKG
jgi:multiple sugar transport system permease protein